MSSLSWLTAEDEADDCRLYLHISMDAVQGYKSASAEKRQHEQLDLLVLSNMHSKEGKRK